MPRREPTLHAERRARYKRSTICKRAKEQVMEFLKKLFGGGGAGGSGVPGDRAGMYL